MWWELIREWALRELAKVKKAPVAVAIVLVLGGTLGWYAASKFYAERFAAQAERLQGLKEQLGKGKQTQTLGGRNDLISSWSGGSLLACAVMVNGQRLSDFAHDNNAILLCGLRVADRDRFTDHAITISRPFGIDPSFAMQTPISSQMNAAIIEISHGVQRPAVAPGTPLAVNVAIWYEVAVIPKTIDPSVIQTLSDVERFGGHLFPGETRGTILEHPIS